MSKIDSQKRAKAKDAVEYYMSGSGYHPGSFALALVQTIFKADPDNLAKLRKVFPEYVDAVLDIRSPNRKDINKGGVI